MRSHICAVCGPRLMASVNGHFSEAWILFELLPTVRDRYAASRQPSNAAAART